MDHGGQCEWEAPVMSQCEGDRISDNPPCPKPLGSQNLNLTETRTPCRTNTLTREHSPVEDIGVCKPGQSPSDNNGVVPDTFPLGSRDDEDEGEDELMKEVDESEESSGFIDSRSPSTPMTDSSFSETGSLLETPFSPGTSPVPSSPLNIGAAPGVSYPLYGPVQPGQQDPDVDSRFPNTVSGDAGGGFVSCTAGHTYTTGPVGSPRLTCTSTSGPAGPSTPPCIDGAITTAGIEALNSSSWSTTSETVHSTGPTCSNASVLGSDGEPMPPKTEGSTSTEACHVDLSTSVAGQISATTETPGTRPTPCSTEPFHSQTAPKGSVSLVTCAKGPSTSSTPGHTSMSAPTSATGPTPRPALLACLEELEHRADDNHLPQYLHQIAEAFVNQEDYRRAIWCIQLERLYHQRLLENLSSLQKQWERSCRSTSTSDLETQLDTLAHICQTHNRPAASNALCASLELLKASMTHDEKPPGELTSCTSGHLTEGELEVGQRDTETRLTGKMQPIKSSTGMDHFDDVRPTAGEESAGTSNGLGGRAVHTAPPITAGSGIPPATGAEMDWSKPAGSQGVEGEATQEKHREEEEERGSWESQEDAHALEMEDKGGGGEVEEEGGEAVPEDTELRGIEEVVPLLQQEAVAEENQWEVTQLGLHSQPWEEEGAQLEQEEQDYGPDIIKESYHLDDQAKLISVEEVMPACGLISILKKRSVCVSECPEPVKAAAKRRVRFKVADDGYNQEVGGGDSCLLLFLLCLVTVVISVGGTALYCALGDAHSTVCQDFSRNADFYVGQMQRGISHLQHWLAPGS
ncbi:consortin isoform X1 [Gadus macrocephalus]|uniref:consortin isoform X1 n=1 Tax=Gadus macrocephalus TaxID=80720 RepID=UPI0028CB3B58|nr:consortin isoform X1 [Gadus macrocephalus]